MKAKEDPRNRAATPWPIVRELAFRFAGGAFDLDPCAEPTTAKAPVFFTREDDGLLQSWGPDLATGLPTRVFFNPPYKNIGAWIRKAYEEVLSGHVRVAVGLVPPGTSTRWMQLARTHGEIHHFVGRIQFEAPKDITYSTNRGDSVVVVFRRPLVVRDISKAG